MGPDAGPIYCGMTLSVVAGYNSSNGEESADSVSNTYDAAGNRISVTSAGNTVSYSYNGLNQLVSSTDGNTTTTYAYDANGNLTEERCGNERKIYTFSPEGTMTSEVYTEFVMKGTVNERVFCKRRW